MRENTGQLLVQFEQNGRWLVDRYVFIESYIRECTEKDDVTENNAEIAAVEEINVVLLVHSSDNAFC
jgi:hypothetical protein